MDAVRHSCIHADRPLSDCIACRTRFQATILEAGKATRREFPWRRADTSSYELVIAEILLQQTRAEQVARVLPTILRRCPDWSSLATTSIKELEALLKPLGLHRRRARVLQALGKAILDGGLPRRAAELEALPGIGQYIARAIAVQLWDEVAAPIDTNVIRVLERVFGPRKLADARYDSELQQFALTLVPKARPAQYLEAILDFAAAVCLPRIPRCNECPMSACNHRLKVTH